MRDPRWKWTEGHEIGISIDGLRNNPKATLIFKRVVFSHKATYYQVFYEEMEKGPPPISSTRKNLLLTLEEKIGITVTAPAGWSQIKRLSLAAFFSPTDRMWYCFWLLLSWVPFANLNPSSCELCLHITQTGNIIARTLLFHNYYSCAGTVTRSCFHNGATYSVCSHNNQHTCFEARGPLITQTQIINLHLPILVYLDACVAVSYTGDTGISRCTTLS
jgi:hypothetical protein